MLRRIDNYYIIIIIIIKNSYVCAVQDKITDIDRIIKSLF